MFSSFFDRISFCKKSKIQFCPDEENSGSESLCVKRAGRHYRADPGNYYVSPIFRRSAGSVHHLVLYAGPGHRLLPLGPGGPTAQ